MPPTTRKSPSRSTRPPAMPPQPQDPNSKYAPTAWGNNANGPEELTLPSGQLVLVRRPGIEGLMKAGVLRNMDALSNMVNEKHIKRVDGQATEIDMTSMVEDDEGMAEITRVVDKILIYCVLAPQVHTTPDDVTRREPGVIYADMVDLVDKMFLFQYVVGGTRDLESFRGELDQLLGGVDPQQDVPSAAKRPVQRARRAGSVVL